MINDLVQWLREQIDDDARRLAARRPADDWAPSWDAEDYARANERAELWTASWHTLGCGYNVLELSKECTCGVPARVLAEIAAKRAVLDAHAGTSPPYDTCLECGSTEIGWQVAMPCPTVRLLAQPYAGRPGWSEDWAL